MPEFDAHIFDKLRDGIKKTMDNMADIVGKAAVDFTKGNFDLQGYRGNVFTHWPTRAHDVDPTRPLLFLKGFLKNAIVVLDKSKETVSFGVNGKLIPYAKIHNEGGTIRVNVTPKLRKWAWAMYYKETGVRRKGKGVAGPRLHGQEARNDDGLAGMYKGIALTKKEQINIKIPQRQYMPLPGEENAMMRQYIIGKILLQLQKAI